ncbi:VCBS repeat-containing protein [Endozoicomonas sp. SM1973]|uniref:VCBS repeat-containing protein n=1 Tax=Spartinivicinus marinus TaxID=2994442 RepID=A0A853IDV8_9GAMM|nr:VCBS repeat-containing protein [Spartinivicinus marinus]MCX4025318.1 VCBS repeat-containing protein [Spartinivicinus marinus]NYZ70032.1 VCBS repeat-containing protein [Spartinivicinus marinus]
MKKNLTKSIQLAVLSGICATSTSAAFASTINSNIDQNKLLKSLGVIELGNKSYFFDDIDNDSQVELLTVYHNGATGFRKGSLVWHNKYGHTPNVKNIKATKGILLANFDGNQELDLISFNSKGIRTYTNFSKLSSSSNVSRIKTDKDWSEYNNKQTANITVLGDRSLGNEPTLDLVAFQNGYVHLAFSQWQSGKMSYYKKARAYTKDAKEAKEIIVRDIDDNGHSDFIFFKNNNISVKYTYWGPEFSRSEVKLVDPELRRMEKFQVSDINEDGINDILAIKGKAIYLSTGNYSGTYNRFKKITNDLRLNQIDKISIVDINNDGYKDIIGINFKKMSFSISLNVGSKKESNSSPYYYGPLPIPQSEIKFSEQIKYNIDTQEDRYGVKYFSKMIKLSSR